MIDENLRRWLIKAFEDYRTIKNEFRLPEEEIVTSAVCFHAQQFVEKILKAYLYSKNIEFGRTHNLEFLLELCSQVDKDFSSLEIGELSDYATEIRYPNNFYIPSIEEAKECFKIVERVKEFVLKKLEINEGEIR